MAKRAARSPGEGDALSALAALYREVDAAFAGWSCPASTECCRFGVTGREPYVTSIELAAIRHAVAARGGERARQGARAGKSTPARRLDLVQNERACAFLDAEGRCVVYAARPLGCRTFFCDRASPGERVERSDIAGFVRALQSIAAAHEPDGDRGRPLSRALEAKKGRP